MRRLGYAAAALAVCFSGCGAGAGAGDTPTSRTDPFLRLVLQAISVETSGRWDDMERCDWERIEREAGKAAGEAERTKRREYVELWKAIAAVRDRAATRMRDSAGHGDAFSEEALYFLGGWRVWGARISRDRILAKMHRSDVFGSDIADERIGLAFDPWPYLRYLLREDLPGWAAKVRFVAAGLLAGDGDREGMDVLVSRFRALNPEAKREPVRWSCNSADFAACTAKALPFWEPLLEDESPHVRRWAADCIETIPGDRARDVFLTWCLRGEDRLARQDAAMELLERGRRDAIPVLEEIVRSRMPHANFADKLGMVHVLCKLEEYKVPGLPWEDLEKDLDERALVEQPPAGVNDGSQQVMLAGDCLSAGRDRVALPFLRKALDSPRTDLAFYAASTLVKSGNILGLEWLVRHTPGVNHGECFTAVGEYLSRGTFTAEELSLACDLARKTYESRQRTWGEYASRLDDYLGAAGLLCRVKSDGGTLKVAAVVETRYEDAAWPRQMAALYRARVLSVEVSARQQKTVLPLGFARDFAKQEINTLSELARSGKGASADQAAEALKQLSTE